MKLNKSALIIFGIIIIVVISCLLENKSRGGELMTGKVNAVIEVQDLGTIALELDADTAPITVTNFVNLANQKFYDGLTFHRVVGGFMIQGGDPLGDTTGGSGKTIKGEFAANGVPNDISHTRGTISMARATDYDSASSQFFIVQEDSTYLDGSYSAFGHVTSGMEYVDAIVDATKNADANGLVPEDERFIIKSIRIID